MMFISSNLAVSARYFPASVSTRLFFNWKKGIYTRQLSLSRLSRNRFGHALVLVNASFAAALDDKAS